MLGKIYKITNKINGKIYIRYVDVLFTITLKGII